MDGTEILVEIERAVRDIAGNLVPESALVQAVEAIESESHQVAQQLEGLELVLRRQAIAAEAVAATLAAFTGALLGPGEGACGGDPSVARMRPLAVVFPVVNVTPDQRGRVVPVTSPPGRP